MKSMKVLSLVLLATSLASGAVYARGGGAEWAADGRRQCIQRRPWPTHRATHSGTHQRTQKREGSQAGDAQRNEYRYENREQVRSENTLPSMQ